MTGHHALAEAMRRHGQSPGNAYSQPRYGKVSGYSPALHAVKVEFQPEGVISGWMPLGTAGIGNGWGIAIGPEIGDQVLVVFPEGDFSSGVVVARMYSVAQPPPVVAHGEIVIQHSSGALLRFNADGSITLTAPGNLNVTAAATNITGPVNITGNLVVNGTVSGTSTITAPSVNGTTDVQFGGHSGVSHVHSGVQGGPSNTGAPV